MLGRQELFSLPVCTSTLWEHTLVWQNTARLTTIGDVADPEASDSPADPVMVRSYLATCAGLLRPAIPRQRNVMSRKHTMAKAKSQGCLDGTVPILRALDLLEDRLVNVDRESPLGAEFQGPFKLCGRGQLFVRVSARPPLSYSAQSLDEAGKRSLSTGGCLPVGVLRLRPRGSERHAMAERDGGEPNTLS